MTSRMRRLLLVVGACLVLALGSALGAVALRDGGLTSTSPQRARATSTPPGEPASVTLLPAAPASCQCQAQQRVPVPTPPPPPPPPVANGPLIVAGAPLPDGGVPSVAGKVLLVSIAQQWIWGYDNGTLMLASPVTTGMPQLPTPRGTYHIFWKVQDTMFYSPWPPGSPYYYTPEHVNYALEFKAGGFFLHDAPWRLCFGPGTNVPHTCPGATVQETGSHGCVNMPTPTGAWVYAWTPDGTTVIIR